ncbi:MAG: hypothetical protein ISS77_02250 [Phycisphaerae bacterium]|nr:hypothetical protein [Phycisphaerae bacterium]
MARWWNVGKDGTVFINCLKPAKNLLLKAKTAPPRMKVGLTIAAVTLAAGGIGYYIYKKTFPPKENPS